MTSTPVRDRGDLHRRKIREIGDDRVELGQTAGIQCALEPLRELLLAKTTVCKMALEHRAEPLTLGIRGPGPGIGIGIAVVAPRAPLRVLHHPSISHRSRCRATSGMP